MSGDSLWRPEDDGLLNDSEDNLDPAIQDLLDLGYDQLDGFTNWLEETLGLDARTAQQDAFNAESLLDYLANYQHKPAAEINEFDLRWFLFSHYIRKAIADTETQERLPDSLRRFFEYLRAEHLYEVPDWLYTTLDDRAFYIKRLRGFLALNEEDEQEWQEGFQAWCEELEEELAVRSLLIPRHLGEGLSWDDAMRWQEAGLYQEANTLWQQERLELLEMGLPFEMVQERLAESYLLWLETPQDKLDDLTPREVVLKERRDHSDEVEEDDGSEAGY